MIRVLLVLGAFVLYAILVLWGLKLGIAQWESQETTDED